MKPKIKLSVLTIGIAMASLLPSITLAASVTLYESASTTAKPVGMIDLSQGVIPIYQPKDSTWVKVADPTNGNVGWIESKALDQSGTTSFTFKQQVSGDSTKPYTYQVFEFGNSKKLSDKETQQSLLKMQQDQRNMQESVGKAIKSMVNELYKVYDSQWQMMQDSRFPIIMPVVVVPATVNTTPENTPSKNSPAKQTR